MQTVYIDNDNSYELYHYGVKGMKWGIRKSYTTAKKGYNTAKESDKAYRKKLSNIADNEQASAADRKYAANASKPASVRVLKSASNVAIGVGFRLALKGLVDPNSKVDYNKLAKEVAKEVAKDYAFNEAMARSVASKYNDDGIKKNGKGPSVITREQAILTGVKVAKRAYPVASAAAGKKYFQAKAKRAENERRFNQWGGNILEAKFDPIVGIDPDSYRVY